MSNIQKCWYCKRNDADEISRNKEKFEASYYEIKGPFKYSKDIKKEWKIARCKDCEIIHSKGTKVVELVFIITFIVSYITFCIFFNDGWIRFIISILLSIFPAYVITYLVAFVIGNYNAIKYKTQPKWARGGNVL